MDKVAAWSVGTVARTVERATQFGLIAGVPLQVAQLIVTVRKLALVPILALSGLLKGPAQLGLVSVESGNKEMWRRILELETCPDQKRACYFDIGK